jgi:hypothetical protein
MGFMAMEVMNVVIEGGMTKWWRSWRMGAKLQVEICPRTGSISTIILNTKDEISYVI